LRTEESLFTYRYGGVDVKVQAGMMFGDSVELGVTERQPLDAAKFRAGWCQVLTLAMLDYWFHRPGTSKFKSARDWIFYSGESAPNSFDNIAAFLGMDASRVRAAIAARREEFQTNQKGARAVLKLLNSQGNGTRVLFNQKDDETEPS
jgi:hypothetical protein